MKGKIGAIWTVILLATFITALPAHAVVIEEVVKHHPLVAFLNSWSSPVNDSHANPPVTPKEDNSLLLPQFRDLSTTSTMVSTDNVTVEVVPIHVPKLPAAVVFAFYLVGALVFYTLLVLVAQPGPSEYY
ncbi:MAG: hypothetical protein RMM08_02650 [Armatimonadota bacterium]|nr:hypothetical protein [bacterium]MDW8320238.1 hypothetical protein [Armatimonadota bacterium]